MAEGVRFDDQGRARAEDFLTAQDLATAAGLDLDYDSVPWRDSAGTGSPLALDQQAFFAEAKAG